MISFALLIILLCRTGLVTSSLIDGLLPNGNFELGPNPSNMKGVNAFHPHAIPNWEISGFVQYIKSGQKEEDMLLVVPEGKYAVRLGNNASLKTKVHVKRGLFHTISFSVARTCAQTERLNVSVSPGKNWGLLPMQTIYSCNGWDTISWGFLAKGNEVQITFHHPQTQADQACGPIIDLVALKAFPPSKVTTGNHLRPAEILKNGNFEEGPYFLPNTSSGVLIPPNTENKNSPLIGWTVECIKAVRYIDSHHFSVPEGKRAVELVAGRESSISQTVKTKKGKEYNLVFYVGDARNNCEGEMLVGVVAGKSTFQVKYDSAGEGGSEMVKLEFTAEKSLTKIRFLSLNYHMRNDASGGLCGPVIDGVRLS